MINTSQNRQSKEKPSAARLTFYLCVTVFAVCLSVVAAGWLIVTRTEGGWYNLPWLLLPVGVIGLLSAGLWMVHSDNELKKKRLADLGFEQPDYAEQLHVSKAIQSMFQATTSVTVVASVTIQQDVRCCVAEVTEIVSRSTGSDDHTSYKYSTVCFLENNKRDTPPFRIQPHNNVAKTLLRRLVPWRRKSGFDDWYDGVQVDAIHAPNFLTPEMRHWLGGHSCWSRLQPWSLVGHNRQIMAYRHGTCYEAAQYPTLFSDIQTLAGLWNSTSSVTALDGGESAQPPTPGAVRFPQDFSHSREDLQHLVSQTPTRHLRPYWIRLTRSAPVYMIGHVLFAIVAFAILPDPLMNLLRRSVRAAIAPPCAVGIALALSSLILGSGLRWHWWIHRQNRRLLRQGEMTSGSIERCRRKDNNRSQNSSQYEIRVKFSVSGKPHTATCRFLVPDKSAGALTKFSNTDQQVVVFFDGSRPAKVVLPQFLPFCR